MRVINTTIGILLFITILNSGCVSYNRLRNYQIDSRDSTILEFVKPPELRIQPNDVLSIQVYSRDEESLKPFKVVPQGSYEGNRVEAYQLNGFLVDQFGNIYFPVIGEIRLIGLTVPQAKDKIKNELLTYLKDPVVRVRMINFKVTVTGEVNNPGAFTIFNERISVPDAFALAGGLTDYANRRKILIVREEKGVLTLNQVNIQEAEFFNSDLYYLKQNDMIYVEPIRAKAGAIPDKTNKIIPVITGLGTVIAIALSLFR